MVLAAAMMMMHGLYRLILTMSGVHRRWTSAQRHLCCAEMSFAGHGTLMHTWLNRQELTMPHVDCLHLIVPPTMQLWIICRNCLVIFFSFFSISLRSRSHFSFAAFAHSNNNNNDQASWAQCSESWKFQEMTLKLSAQLLELCVVLFFFHSHGYYN